VADETTIATLATETGTPRHVIKRLYDEEIVALNARSAVKSFIPVIAGRRVRQRLGGRRKKPR
jgi:hypothetical protein